MCMTPSLFILDFIAVVHNNKFSVHEIIGKYGQDPKHLKFMSADPTNVVLEHAHNAEIVKFRIKNYNIDCIYAHNVFS